MRLAWTFLPAALLLLWLSPFATAAAPSFVGGFERLRAAGGDWRAEMITAVLESHRQDGRRVAFPIQSPENPLAHW